MLIENFFCLVPMIWFKSLNSIHFLKSNKYLQFRIRWVWAPCSAHPYIIDGDKSIRLLILYTLQYYSMCDEIKAIWNSEATELKDYFPFFQLIFMSKLFKFERFKVLLSKFLTRLKKVTGITEKIKKLWLLFHWFWCDSKWPHYKSNCLTFLLLICIYAGHRSSIRVDITM